MNRREFLQTTGGAMVTWALAGASRADTRVPDRRPNILLLLPDQHRFDWLGNRRGMPIHTPNLTALAHRGVQFTNAICPSPLCAPSRAALASGKEYDRCRTPDNATNYPIEQATVYTLLRDGGYHVMGCGKFDLHKASWTWGLDGRNMLKEWGFSDGIDNGGKWDAVNSGAKAAQEPYMAYLEQRGLRLQHCEDFERRRVGQATFATPLPDDAYCDNWIGRNGLQLLDRAPSGKPWFMQVNFTGPHDPWDITAGMEKSARTIRGFPTANGCGGLTPEQHLAVRQNYSAMVENIDRWVGRYVDALTRRGELDNTILVYSSDHGEMLGDHDRWGKQVPFQPSVGVPLIVAGPRVHTGAVCTAATTTLDLAATFLEIAHVARPKDMDSLSLLPVLAGSRNRRRDVVFSGLDKWRIAFDGRYKLVREFPKDCFGKVPPPRSEGERLAMYDLEQDPGENHDLTSEAPEQAARLLRCFDALRS